MKFKLFIIGFAIGFAAGATVQQWRNDTEFSKYKEDQAIAQLQIIKQVRETEGAAKFRAEKKAAELQMMLSEISATEKVVTKHVIKYIENPNTGRCLIPNEWLLAHDAAATSGLPEASKPSGNINAATRSLTDRDILKIVTENYGICQHRLALIKGWQDWYIAATTTNATRI